MSLFKQLAQRAGQLASTVRDCIVDMEATIGHAAGPTHKSGNNPDPPAAKRARLAEPSQVTGTAFSLSNDLDDISMLLRSGHCSFICRYGRVMVLGQVSPARQAWPIAAQVPL